GAGAVASENEARAATDLLPSVEQGVDSLLRGETADVQGIAPWFTQLARRWIDEVRFDENAGLRQARADVNVPGKVRRGNIGIHFPSVSAKGFEDARNGGDSCRCRARSAIAF